MFSGGGGGEAVEYFFIFLAFARISMVFQNIFSCPLPRTAMYTALLFHHNSLVELQSVHAWKFRHYTVKWYLYTLCFVVYNLHSGI